MREIENYFKLVVENDPIFRWRIKKRQEKVNMFKGVK